MRLAVFYKHFAKPYRRLAWIITSSNLQVRGRKFVRLINPSFRQKLYLFEDLMRKNTSQVDVEVPDLGQFPDFATVQCEDFVMEAGDCLFIPKGYFHHVRSLEKSISVSIWFGVP